MAETQTPVRQRAPLMVGGLLLVICCLWLGIGFIYVYDFPVVGWFPLPIMSALAARACFRVGAGSRFDVGTRRFWRHMGMACTVLTVAVVSNAWDAVGGPGPSQRLAPLTQALYLSVLAIGIWALLRLPAWQRERGDWTRFGLDACVVLVTSGVFVWHFSLRQHPQWMHQTGSAVAVISLVVVAGISMLTYAKVAFAGAGLLDRRALHLLAAGTAISGVLGGLTPFLVDRPYLSSSLVAVSTAVFSVQLAAERQRRSTGTTPPARRRSRRINLVPYLSMGAADALLLGNGTSEPRETVILQAAVVVLTVLVVIRHIVVLRENRRLHDTLEHQVTHDRLTGVGNRALFEQRAEQAFDKDLPVHVLVLDLDDFKTVNDRLGHNVGDVLITEIANRLDQEIGANGTVARLGGDEFVALLTDATAAQIESRLQRLLHTLQQPVPLASTQLIPRVSIGVTTVHERVSAPELLRRADVAMYAAKAAGGNQWTWFDPIMDTLADETARLSADLRNAITGDQLYLLFQPIVALADETIAGVEALLRWRHPEHGLISPDTFIPLAEHNGFIIELGHWVLEQACRQAAAWQRTYGPAAPAKVSINVSARQLAEPGFPATVAEVLQRTGVDRSRLLIEVTETAVLSTGTAIDAVAKLKQLGLQIALDDFGTGHSSLSLLLDCPVDVLKVDKSFVSGSAADSNGAAIVETLIGFTDRLHIQAVAEGVETPEQATRLHEAGYRYAQGYLFARPMTATDLETRLRSTASLIEPLDTHSATR